MAKSIKKPYSIKVDPIANSKTAITINIKTDKNINYEINTSSENILRCSCGVLEVKGIYWFVNVLCLMRSHKSCKSKEIELQIIKEAFLKLIKFLKKTHKVAFIIFSNLRISSLRSSFNANKDVNKILDEICICSTNYKLNPNSGNYIKVWTL